VQRYRFFIFKISRETLDSYQARQDVSLYHRIYFFFIHSILPEIMPFPVFSLLTSMFPVLKREEKIVCFHCGEKMVKAHALVINFDRSPQSVCCHGCLAILRTVEQNQLVSEYLLSRANQVIVR
jgi:hypothetical protein